LAPAPPLPTVTRAALLPAAARSFCGGPASRRSWPPRSPAAAFPRVEASVTRPLPATLATCRPPPRHDAWAPTVLGHARLRWPSPASLRRCPRRPPPRFSAAPATPGTCHTRWLPSPSSPRVGRYSTPALAASLRCSFFAGLDDVWGRILAASRRCATTTATGRPRGGREGAPRPTILLPTHGTVVVVVAYGLCAQTALPFPPFLPPCSRRRCPAAIPRRVTRAQQSGDGGVVPRGQWGSTGRCWCRWGRAPRCAATARRAGRGGQGLRGAGRAAGGQRRGMTTGGERGLSDTGSGAQVQALL